MVKRRKDGQRGDETNCGPQTPCKSQQGTKEGNGTHNSLDPCPFGIFPAFGFRNNPGLFPGKNMT